MNVHGLYKMTLLDYPEHLACTIFTGGCNFRCPFCHNASLVTHIDQSALIPEADIFQFLSSRVGILEGVCITGGEPTLQSDLLQFIQNVKNLGFKVKLDTNGSNPELLAQLLNQNLLDYVAMDIKNSPTSYAKTIDLHTYDLSNINASVTLLMQSSIDYEFRTTVVKELHTMQDFLEIADWISNCAHYYLQGFKDSKDLIGEGYSGYEVEELQAFARKLKEKIPNVAIRGIE